VGGHCIAVDPYFIVSDYPMESKIIGTAREVNNYKSFWCAEKIENVKLQFELNHGRKPVISLMGLAFKPNIDDLRESKALEVAETLLAEGYEVISVEPNIQSHKNLKILNLFDAIDQADLICLLVKHREFLEPEVKKKLMKSQVLDFCGVLS